MQPWTATAVWALLVTALPAAAQNLRCKNDFAERGDSKLTVLTKCGEPVLKDSFCRAEPIQPAAKALARQPCHNVDAWSYRPGSGQFVTVLEFEEGVLRAIRYGDRIP